jgi:hypothetical protein
MLGFVPHPNLHGLINGQWPAFENYIASLGEHFTLAPKPVPAEPYAAAA